MTAESAPILPGRLGMPSMLLRDDPRADPRMIAALLALGLGGAPTPSPVDGDSPLDEILARTTRHMRVPPLAVGLGIYLPTASTLMIVLGAILLGAISPGPSFVLVARTAVAVSRRDALATALGMGAGGLVFAGDMDGYVIAFDAATGKLLWKSAAGGPITSSPMTYAVDGRQYVAVAAGGSLFSFGLPERVSGDGP